jgi:hypothetical protein
MMNSKTTLSRTTILWSLGAILVVAGVITLVYSVSAGQENAADEVNAVYTNAAATVAAQQLTLQAGIPSATSTPATTPTATSTPLASPTLNGASAVFSTATLGSSGGVVSTCDNSVYISDVTIPDNTAVTPGQAFTKTWRVSNNGTCTWSTAYQIILISGDGMSGKATPIGQSVAPGQSADISVAMVAPSTTGTIQGTWRLQNDKSQPFGTVLTVVIKVGGATGATATVTSTGVVAATSASTATTAPVATTAVPTNTTAPTNTSAPTATPETPSP